MTEIDHDPALRDRTLASLAESLTAETRLLVQLSRVLQDQRSGVAQDDIEAVDGSVHDAHRIMQTLAEARRRRNTLVRLLTDQDDLAVGAIPAALGARMTDDLRGRHEELERTARALSLEVKVNRAVLTRAIHTGHDHVRQLFAPAQTVTYGGPGQAAAAAGEPVAVNRRV
jgi:hypothetical protein